MSISRGIVDKKLNERYNCHTSSLYDARREDVNDFWVLLSDVKSDLQSHSDAQSSKDSLNIAIVSKDM